MTVVNTVTVAAMLPALLIGAHLASAQPLDNGSLAAILAADSALTFSPKPFTDDGLTAGASVIRAVHITELRTRVDALRARYGEGAYSYTEMTITAGTTVVQAVDITELRTALSEAYVAAGLTAPTYTDPILGSGATVKAVHISELRSAVTTIEP